MTILVLAEHHDTQLDEATAKAVSAAGRMGGEIHVLVAGSGCRAAAEAAAGLAGVARVLLADASSLSNRLAEPVAALVVGLASGYDAILAPSTTSGRNILPRVAALLDVMQISDVIAVDGPDLFQRPIYAGNVIQTVRSTDAKKVLTVRASSFPAASVAAAAAPIETVAIPEDPGRSAFVRSELSRSERPELAGAGSSCRAGGRWPPPKTSRPCWRRWLIRWARRSARAARPSMPAMSRTISRSARRARSLRQTSTLPVAFPGRSSILQA